MTHLNTRAQAAFVEMDEATPGAVLASLFLAPRKAAIAAALARTEAAIARAVAALVKGEVA